MPDDDRWTALRERCETLEPGSELVTPVSRRPFAVAATYDDRIDVRFRDSGESRSLEREQFDVLADRLERRPVSVAALPPGVEPYATLLSLLESYAVDDDGDQIVHDPDGDGTERPFVRSAEAARTPPERVHDDALLLAAILERVDATDFDSLDTEALTDCYVLCSDVSRGADRLRKDAGAALLERLGPDQSLRGRFGAVHRTTREYRRPKEDATVLDALDERGIPHEWVLGVDPEKLDVVLATTDLEEEAVYDVDEQVYAQKTSVDEDEKFSRLQGLADRLDELEERERELLEEDLERLEDRLEESLSVG